MMIDVGIKKRFKSFYIDAAIKFKSVRNVLFGVSGSGKSSILKMIAGFFNPDSGYIAVKENVLFDKKGNINIPIYKRNVGYIPQEYTLFPHMNVKENILYGVKAKKIELDRERFDFLVRKTGLEGYLKAYPYELSGGQRQRVSLVRSLLVDPNILLLDEPFSALDKPIRDELRELLTDIVDQIGILTIFVSHDLDEAYEFAEELAIIENGRIVQLGSRDEVFYNPANSNVAKILGYKNIFKVEKVSDGRIFVKGFAFSVDNVRSDSRFIFIRPENVLILRLDRDISDKENVVLGKVDGMYSRAGSVLIKVRSGEFEVYTMTTPHVVKKMYLSVGSRIAVSLKGEAIGISGV